MTTKTNDPQETTLPQGKARLDWVNEKKGLARSVRLMTALRSDGGCPWDNQQSHGSLRKYLIEETYELVEAIDTGNDEDILEELGDVLLQVLFHARIAQQENRFDIDDVADRLSNKMIQRHPHVFGDKIAETSEDVLRNWEANKRARPKKGTSTAFGDGLPKSMPGLTRAQTLSSRAAQYGFDWPNADAVVDKIREELEEATEADPDRQAEEIGDLMFAVVNWARMLGLDSEKLLHEASDKFAKRFEYVLANKSENGTLTEMERLWNEVKAKGNA